MRKIILFVALAALAGCTTTGTTQEMVNLAQATQTAKIAAAQLTAAGCQTGAIPAQDCATAQLSYEGWKALNATKLNALLLNCQDAALQAQVQKIIDAGYPVLSFTEVAK